MNKKLKELGYKFLYTPDTKVWHYRSSTPKRFWRQNFRYAIGRVLMARSDRKLINPLHIITGFSLPIILAIILLSLKFSVTFLMGLLFLCLGFLFFFSIWGLLKLRSFKAALNIPLAIILLATSWSLGFMKESLFPTPINAGQK